MRDSTLRLILTGDDSRLNKVLGQSTKRLAQFGRAAKRELDHLRKLSHSMGGVLGGIGITVGGTMFLRQAGQLDKTLTQITQTADEARSKSGELRAEIFKMGTETGQSVEDLQTGFNNAVQAGLSFKEALPVIQAVNKAVAVTGASSDQLSSSLTVASSVFDFDLSKPGQALVLLDKMRVAGKLGNAELENLAQIFPRVGFTAKRAGMSFEDTLGFVEALSQAEKQPERLGTLAVSWLRLFTNAQYMKKASGATGVKFFDQKGNRRAALDVFGDIKTLYDKQRTDAQRHNLVSAFLEGADTETITASVAFLQGNFLQNAKQFSQEINGAAGTLAKELPDAIDNAIDQTGRLKNELRRAADAFTKPLRTGITKGIQLLLNKPEKGGLGFTGEGMMGGAATAGILGYLAYRIGGSMGGKFLGRLGSTAAGTVTGKALEETTGVTPVFVTNMPGEGIGGAGKYGGIFGGGMGKWGRLALSATTVTLAAGAVYGLASGLSQTAKDNGWAPRLYGGIAGAPGMTDVRSIKGARVLPKDGLGPSLDKFLENSQGTQKQREEWKSMLQGAVTNKIDIRVDKQGGVWVDSNNPDTTVNLKRGGFAQ